MAPQWASDELAGAVGSAAAELGAGIHLHALESRLQRAWGDGFSDGRELERLVAARRARASAARSRTASGCASRTSTTLARCGATVVHNASSNLRLAAGIAPLRSLVAAGVGVALGLDDMGIADDDDMLAEVRVAHALQRVRGEEAHPRLTAAQLYGLMWDGGAQVVGAAAAIGRLEPGRRADVIVVDLAALRAPYADPGADVWELLLARGKALHVESAVVDGRVLMRERTLQHLDRAALMGEVAEAAAAAVARRRSGRRYRDRGARPPHRGPLPGARLARRLTVRTPPHARAPPAQSRSTLQTRA